MYIFRFLYLGLLLCIAQVTHAFAADLVDGVETASPSIVHIAVTHQPNSKENASRIKAPDVIIGKGVTTGSGVIISEDGYIVTVAYLLEDFDKIEVLIADQKKYQARLVGRDRRTGVALIKIDASQLKPTKIGDLSKLRLGEHVFSAGVLPEALGATSVVTNGIVSAYNPENATEYLPMIQTTAALTPGMGGGGLFNASGELIGINAQIYKNTAHTAPLSFCIPIANAMEIVTALKKHGRVRRSGIGIQFGEVNRELANTLELPTTNGVLIHAIEPGSPAEQANIQPGDIILQIANREIKRVLDLPKTLGPIEPGTPISIQVWRKGKTREFMVTTREISVKP